MSKVAKEVAEQEFDRMAKARRLDVDVDTMPEKDREDFEKLKDQVVKAIMGGQLVIDDEGVPTLTLVFPVEITGRGKWEQLTFYRPKGAMLTASDGFEDNAKGAKMHAMLASMCKVSRPVFDELDWYDHKVCAALFNLFLA